MTRVYVASTPGDDALRAAIPTFKLMPDMDVPGIDAVFHLTPEDIAHITRRSR